MAVLSTLQNLPYDLRTHLLSGLDNINDLLALQQTCKAFDEPFKHNEVAIISVVAPRHFSAYWPEILRLMKAQSAATNTVEADRPKLVETALLDSDKTITKAELRKLLLLEATIYRIIGRNQPYFDVEKHTVESEVQRFKLLCSCAYVDLLTPGKMTNLLSPDGWSIKNGVDRVRLDSFVNKGLPAHLFGPGDLPSSFGLSQEDYVALRSFISVALSNSGGCSFIAYIIAMGSGKKAQPLKGMGSGFMLCSGGLDALGLPENVEPYDDSEATESTIVE